MCMVCLWSGSVSLVATRRMQLDRFVGSVDEEFLCPVCRNVLVQPRRAPCDHEVCAAHADSTCNVSGCLCPTSEPDWRDAVKTAKLLDKLQIRCDNSAAGCEWVGSWGDLRAHRTSVCHFETVLCPFAGCATAVQRIAMPDHKAACGFRRVQCAACLGTFKVQDLPLHEERCGLVIVLCQYCDCECRRDALGEHQQRDCVEAVIPCPLADLGCTVRMKRKELASHLHESMEHHLNTLVHVLRTERAAHAEEVAILRNDLEAQRATLRSQLTVDGLPLHEVVHRLSATTAEHSAAVETLERGRVIVVDARGCGHFKSVGDALRRCASGDTILLRPGRYNEACVLDKDDVSLRGSGCAETIITATQGCAVLVTGRQCLVSSLSVEARCPVSAAVRIEGSGEVRECRIDGANTSAVQVHGHTVLRKCTIQGSKQSGVDWRSTGEMHECTVTKNCHPNVAVRGTLVASDCKLTLSKHNGIWVKDGGNARLLRCVISDNAYSNVDVCSAQCYLEACDVHSSAKCGVCASGPSVVEVVACEIHDNTLPNVALLPSSSAEIRNSRIVRGRSHGVAVKRGASCRLAGNTISLNADIAVAAEGDGASVTTT